MFTSHQAKLRMHVGLGSPEEIKMGVFLGYIWHERRDKGVSRGDCRCFPVKEEDYVCNVVPTALYALNRGPTTGQLLERACQTTAIGNTLKGTLQL